jgi:hypothetical protein
MGPGVFSVMASVRRAKIIIVLSSSQISLCPLRLNGSLRRFRLLLGRVLDHKTSRLTQSQLRAADLKAVAISHVVSFTQRLEPTDEVRHDFVLRLPFIYDNSH